METMQNNEMHATIIASRQKTEVFTQKSQTEGRLRQIALLRFLIANSN